MTTSVISTQEQTLLLLNQVKRWCRITSTSEDTTIQDLIDAAIEQAENVTWWSLRAKQIMVTYADVPEEIKLPGAPIESIDKVEIYEDDVWTDYTSDYEDIMSVIDMNDFIEVHTTYPLRVTFTTGVYNSPWVNMLMQDLIIAKWESRPEDSQQVNHILKRLAKHRNNATL